MSYISKNSKKLLISIICLFIILVGAIFFVRYINGSSQQNTNQSHDSTDVITTTLPFNAPKHPKKVVSLDIGTIDTLNALGVDVAGIPDNLYIDELHIENAEVVGTLFEPDIEALHKMQPDWILLATLSANKVDAVQDIAPTSDVSIKGIHPYEESIERLNQFAEIFDKQQEAQQWTNRLNNLRDSVKTQVKNYNNNHPNSKALIVLSTGNKISVFGKNSRFGWLGKQLGFNLVQHEEEGEHGAPVSFEYIADVNPDWLLVIDRATAMGMQDTPNAKSVLNNDLVKNTHAWQQDHIIYLRPTDMYVTVGGVQSIERVLKQLDDELAKHAQ